METADATVAPIPPAPVEEGVVPEAALPQDSPVTDPESRDGGAATKA